MAKQIGPKAIEIGNIKIEFKNTQGVKNFLDAIASGNIIIDDSSHEQVKEIIKDASDGVLKDKNAAKAKKIADK